MTTHARMFRRPDPPPLSVVLSGAVALAVAMGIGRFAFTPLMPLMIRDGTLSPGAGAAWAAANYAGYLAGALTAAWFSGRPRLGMMLGLTGVGLMTVAGAWRGDDALPFLGVMFRAAAGLFSAWTLICASSWALAELARRGMARFGAWIYAGVGSGIALTGMLAWLGGRQSAHRLWLELGIIAAAGTVFVWSSTRGRCDAQGQGGARAVPPPRCAPAGGHRGLVVCYGIFGFGYILPATFLPAMAQTLVPDPLVFGLTWPVFGLAAALSVAAAANWMAALPRRRLWAMAQGTMALGTALPAISDALWPLILSAVLVGGTFMVVTMAGLQLAQELVPANPTPLLARMTAAFAAGQIAGPLLVRALGLGASSGSDVLGWTSMAASLLLMASAAWLWLSAQGSALRTD